jgi:ferredoxin-NADP reductase
LAPQGARIPAASSATIDGLAPPLAGTAVYACGFDAMIHDARGLLAGAGLPAARFHFDAFVRSD